VASQGDIIDRLTQSAVSRLRVDLGTVIQRLRMTFASLLAKAHTEGGKLTEDDFNLELAAKLEADFSKTLEAVGYNGALGRLLDTYEEIAAANKTFIADNLGRSFSAANLRSLSRLATDSVDVLLLRGEEAGAKLRAILVTGAHTNAPIADLVTELADRADITFRQALVEAETQLMAFHRDGLAVESFEAGIDLYVYDGPDDGIVRDFCAPLVGKIITLPDLDGMENDGPQPVSRFLGGFRCRHSLSPISLEEAQDMVERRGAGAIAPGCPLARRILLKGQEGPAAKAFRKRVGEDVAKSRATG
jgi:hypothetical protein